MEDKLVSTRELASRLVLSVRTVRSWARAGRIPAIRVASNRYRFGWREVLESLRRDDGHASQREGRHAS